MTQRDIRELRRVLARRQREKAELELQVRSLQAEYSNELVPLQEEVLRLQMERLKEAAQAHRRSARLRNAYHDAQEAYERFQVRNEGDRSTGPTGDENLKATYRRATKECHPDAVPDSYREEAAATFQALESAYEAEQSRAVRAIAEGLERWGFPRAPSESSEPSAPDERATLRQAVSALDTSIDRLRTSDVYRVLSDVEGADVETVVGAQKRELQRRLQELRRRRRSRF